MNQNINSVQINDEDSYENALKDSSKKEISINIFQKFYNYIIGIEDYNFRNYKDNSHSKNEDLDEEIKKLKNLKTGRLPPAHILQHYIFLEAEKNESCLDTDFLKKIVPIININYKGRYGDTALHETCKLSSKFNNTVEIAKILIQNGADKHKLNNFGHSVLHIAASNDNVDLIRFLLKTNDGVDIFLLESQTYEELQTPLHYAAKNGSINVVNCLLREYKPNMEAKDYQGRTPLYLAAEYGYHLIVKEFLRQGAMLDIRNIYEQTALYWICVKCPEIASDVLDLSRTISSYEQKTYFSLKNVDIQPFKNKNGEYEIPDTKSILMFIVETEDLNLIIHPVIECLIKAKWRDYGLIRCYLDTFSTLISLIVWNILGVLVPWETRHKYSFPQDWWRIFLFLIGIIGILKVIISEFVEIKNVSKYQKKSNEQRLEELKNDKRFCHPHDKAQKSFLEKEQLLFSTESTFSLYFKNRWNWYDLLSVTLLLAVIFTHVADIVNHTELLAKTHIRLFSITVVFISLRVFESGRVLFVRFGMLVVTLSVILKKIAVWFVIYCIFWIPFTSAFWMLFGYKKFADKDDENTLNCLNVEEPKNCTVVSIKDMDRYDRTMLHLWLLTFGQSFNRTKMNQIDPIMADILIGLFIGICLLLLVNIFIALLSSTFERVESSAKAYFLLQRATRLIEIEYELPKMTRIRHLNKLKHQFKDEINIGETTQEIDNTQSIINNLRIQLSELNDKLRKVKNNMDKTMKKINEKNERRLVAITTNISETNENNNAKKPLKVDSEQNDKLNKIGNELNQFKNIILSKLTHKTNI